MALDYKTLQAMPRYLASDVEPYCPECGRPWCDAAPALAHATAPFSWCALLLIVVGLVLTITFGSRVASAGHATAEMRSEQAFLGACIDGNDAASRCSSGVGPVALFRVEETRARLGDTTTWDRNRALSPAALGSVALVVGLGSLVRRRHRATSHGRASPTAGVVRRVGGVLLVLVCLLVLALYLDLVALQLSSGVPLTWEALDRAADDALTVISLITGA